MELKRYIVLILVGILAASTTAMSQEYTPGKSYLAPGRSPGTTSKLIKYTLDDNGSGAIKTIHNIANLTVVSRDANDLKAEYRAGFIQGKLQGETIISARDNSWDNAYLIDPSHSFPKQHGPNWGPTQKELNKTADILNANYAAFLEYVNNQAPDTVTAYRLKRLLFRMLGIYHGASLEGPADLDFSGAWLPDSNYFHSSYGGGLLLIVPGAALPQQHGGVIYP